MKKEDVQEQIAGDLSLPVNPDPGPCLLLRKGKLSSFTNRTPLWYCGVLLVKKTCATFLFNNFSFCSNS